MNTISACCAPIEISDSEESQRIVTVFKALADSTRYEIFRLIASQNDSICVCNINLNFEVSQPTISHHLKVLREAGLITVSRRGTWAYYEVDPTSIDVLQRTVASFQPTLMGAHRTP